MLLSGAESIRDVQVAYPNPEGDRPQTDAPNQVSAAQLAELRVRTVEGSSLPYPLPRSFPRPIDAEQPMLRVQGTRPRRPLARRVFSPNVRGAVYCHAFRSTHYQVP